ncbi:Methyltransferase-like protein 22 [Varanus komodoensis]|nr:Methyltransferase-like protein 22 [Varanus komodoensis]
MEADVPLDPENPYSWSEKEIVELHDLSTVILAADVFYDDDLTDAFFRTLYRITSNLTNPSTIYLSVEKRLKRPSCLSLASYGIPCKLLGTYRLNFTRRHMDVVCEAYNHFQSGLKDLLNIRDDKMRYTTQPVQLSFPQHIVYERVEQLVGTTV